MAELVIIRHAKAGWTAAHRTDFDRTLNERGMQDSKRMAGHIQSSYPGPDAFLSSSAVRTRMTVEFLTAGLSDGLTINWLEELYLADPEEILQALRSHARGKIVYLCGHNPGVSDFCSLMTGRSIGDLPTLGTVRLSIDLPSGDWKSLDWGQAEIISLDTPDTLAG